MSASRRWLILIATSIVSFMATLDASIVNIALPYIARELKVPMSTIELVTSVYMIAICVLLIFWGKLSDSVGRIVVVSVGDHFVCTRLAFLRTIHDLTMVINGPTDSSH